LKKPPHTSVQRGAPPASKGDIPDTLIAGLREDLAFRRIASGFDRLRRHAALLDSLDPRQPAAATLLGFVAQWVDIGYADYGLLRRLVPRFTNGSRAALSLEGYAHLRMAEGLVALADENYDAAIHHFQFVVSVADDLTDLEPVAIACFWIGRTLRKEGRYDDALTYTERGRDLALQLGFAPMAAIMRLLESWLYFQKGRPAEARRILHEAQGALEATDDSVSAGNVHSAYGRIARREGRYERALEHFAASIHEFQKRDPQHRLLARSLNNMAFVKRLIANALAEKMDREAARRRKPGGEPRIAAAAHAPHSRDRERFAKLRHESFDHLAAAETIFERGSGGVPDSRGLGNVHIDRGYLHMDSGQLDLAEREAVLAHAVGAEKKDHIILARARILQCMVAVAQFDEGIIESYDDNAAGQGATQQAEDFAREAVEYARHTQNRRLLARAYVWHGLVLAGGQDLDGARDCAEKAEALLRTETDLHGWEDLHDLKRRVQRAGNVDPMLREWSQGLMGGKSFRKISDEFAAIVIPRVWEREGRKVSRVAARLRISPKKVRRILAGAGKPKAK
jgi:tetratricopeptide (TPR) repeat protein